MSKTAEKFNVTLDLGHLLVLDNQPFNKEDIKEQDISERAAKNLRVFFKDIYQVLAAQKGSQEEKRDYDKPENCVILPKPVIVLPRAKPIPKPKPLSKWEKYRAEKGLQAKQKRSRMVYSELADDWVPRWGKGSAKNIEDKAEWAIEEKPGMAGQNPFTLRKQEKNLQSAKQKKRELKNIENGLKDGKKEKSVDSKKTNKKDGKNKKTKLDNDKNLLDKTLETVQKSTASFGKFDKKVKNEKDVNTIKKKKVDTDVLLNRKREKERDKNILSTILKKNK